MAVDIFCYEDYTRKAVLNTTVSIIDGLYYE